MAFLSFVHYVFCLLSKVKGPRRWCRRLVRPSSSSSLSQPAAEKARAAECTTRGNGSLQVAARARPDARPRPAWTRGDPVRTSRTSRRGLPHAWGWGMPDDLHRHSKALSQFLVFFAREKIKMQLLERWMRRGKQRLGPTSAQMRPQPLLRAPTCLSVSKTRSDARSDRNRITAGRPYPGRECGRTAPGARTGSRSPLRPGPASRPRTSRGRRLKGLRSVRRH